jgi:hypothetical protein
MDVLEDARVLRDSDLVHPLTIRNDHTPGQSFLDHAASLMERTISTK